MFRTSQHKHYLVTYPQLPNSMNDDDFQHFPAFRRPLHDAFDASLSHARVVIDEQSGHVLFASLADDAHEAADCATSPRVTRPHRLVLLCEVKVRRLQPDTHGFTRPSLVE